MYSCCTYICKDAVQVYFMYLKREKNAVKIYFCFFFLLFSARKICMAFILIETYSFDSGFIFPTTFRGFFKSVLIANNTLIRSYSRC